MNRAAPLLCALLLAANPLPAEELPESRLTLPGVADELVLPHPADWHTERLGLEEAPTLRIEAPGEPRLVLLLTLFPMRPGVKIDAEGLAEFAIAVARLSEPSVAPGDLSPVDLRGPESWGSFVHLVDTDENLPPDEYRMMRQGSVVVGDSFLVAFTLLSDEGADERVETALECLRSVRVERPLPEPPEGFEWVELTAVRGAVVKPIGWHDRVTSEGGRLRYLLSPSPPDEAGELATGLTIEVIPNASAAFGRLAPNAARALVSSAKRDEGVEALGSWSSEVYRMQLFGCRLRETVEGRQPRIRQLLAIGNPDTDTLFRFDFSTPESSWKDGDAKIADTMLRRFLLDSEI